jgi:hypothetical protein
LRDRVAPMSREVSTISCRSNRASESVGDP